MIKELKLNLYIEISWESFCGLSNVCKNHKSLIPQKLLYYQIKNTAAKYLTYYTYLQHSLY